MADLESRPAVLVTLRIPTEGTAVKELMNACDVKFHDNSYIMTREELLKGISGVHAVLCQSEDVMDHELLEIAGKVGGLVGCFGFNDSQTYFSLYTRPL